MLLSFFGHDLIILLVIVWSFLVIFGRFREGYAKTTKIDQTMTKRRRKTDQTTTKT